MQQISNEVKQSSSSSLSWAWPCSAPACSFHSSRRHSGITNVLQDTKYELVGGGGCPPQLETLICLRDVMVSNIIAGWACTGWLCASCARRRWWPLSGGGTRWTALRSKDYFIGWNLKINWTYCVQSILWSIKCQSSLTWQMQFLHIDFTLWFRIIAKLSLKSKSTQDNLNFNWGWG